MANLAMAGDFCKKKLQIVPNWLIWLLPWVFAKNCKKSPNGYFRYGVEDRLGPG